ncbi:unnamed protein product, partial [marine sediment metagenome]
GITEAVKAVEFLNPTYVIPMHYGTFPLIETNPEELKKRVGEMAKVVILKPGEKFEL